MRIGKAELAPEELLPAEIEPRQIARPACIDDAIGRDLCPVREHYRGRRQLDHLVAGHYRLRGKRGAHDGVEPLRFDRIIDTFERPAVGRKRDVIPRPAITDQRREDPAVRLGDVADEERPQMVATDRVARIDQSDVEPGTALCERERDEAARQAAADDRQVAG